MRARKPPDWLSEERRNTLGHWAAFCLSCGHALRYFEECEQRAPGRVPAVRRADPGALPGSCSARFASAFATACEACGTALRPAELLGAPDQAGRLTICEKRITVTVSSSVTSRL